MRLRLLSRASDLAVLQAREFATALKARWPDLDIVTMTRSASGDRDPQLDLAAATEKGVFTSDLSELLVRGDADVVVHSWKDLPIDSHPGTEVAATLERADPRDLLVVRREAIAAERSTLHVLSSSPRRRHQIESSAPRFLPWPISAVEIAAVRGNVPTRLRKLVAGEADALLVAKAALDRLLSSEAPEDVRRAVRSALDRTRWMVLPVKEHPTAAAQGALAAEIAVDRPDVAELVAAVNHGPTWDAVRREREILASYGGGCHQAVGATVLIRDFGRVMSTRAHIAGREHASWSLETDGPEPPPAAPQEIWPRPEERHRVRRHVLPVSAPRHATAFWVSRADALPGDWRLNSAALVWTSGSRTWERLAARGVWVNGCADGLGDQEPVAIDRLHGGPTPWLRLTHDKSAAPGSLATYTVETEFPEDLGNRTHFFWTSGSQFRQAVGRYPEILAGWHGTGPGRTAQAIRETLGSPSRHRVWLDYDQWLRHVTR